MTNLVGTAALAFWMVTFINDLTNVEIISNWIDNDKLCFQGLINVQFARDSSGGWQIQMKSSHSLSSLNSSHADIQENNGDGYFHVLTNKTWNAQFIAEQTMVVPFMACTSETDKVPDITAEFYRHNEICPEVTPPLGRHCMQVPSVIENQWNIGFQAYLNITPPVTVLDGWKIYFASSRPLSSLVVSQATSIPSQGDIFTFESTSANRQIMVGSSLRIHYVGHKASATDPTPCVTALFTWLGAEDYPLTTPSPTTESNDGTTPQTTSELRTKYSTQATTDRPSTTESPTAKPTSAFTIQPSTTTNPSPTESTKNTITDQPATTENPTTTMVTKATNAPPSCAPYNYTEVLHKSILFYEAQRSGPLPTNNRIPWRDDSALGDKGNGGENLTGGWYDAGDYVKFGFPMAFSTTLLSWGLIEFPQGYSTSGELQNMLDCIRWPLDYFIKAHVNPEEFYGQVGNGEIDHAYWGRPEDMTMSRPAYKIDRNKPGSDLAAETAAAMAAGSIAFREEEPTYAELLLNHSKSLYDFADQYRGKYSDSISDAGKFYSSSSYNDELVWGAAWLYKVTKDENYLQTAERYFTQYAGLEDAGWAFSWDEKTAGVQMLLYELTGKTVYKTAIEKSLDAWLPGGSVSYTPKGLAWRIKWGSNRYAANTAFLALLASEKGLKSSTYKEFGEKQIHYMLGDNGRSYVVGFGTNPPTRPHHGSSSCPNSPAPCGWNDFNNPGPNPQILYGALVGGPDQTDFYQDKRSDFIMNEVTCDYNAGFQSAVAALKSIDVSSCSTTSTIARSLSSPTNSLTTLQVTTDKTATTESSTTEIPSTETTSTITDQPSTTENPTTEIITDQPPTTENPITEITSTITDQPPTTENPTTEIISTITDQPSTTKNPTTEITSTITVTSTDQPTETTKSPTEPHACGDVSVPSEFNSLELPVVVLQDWSQGFTGQINLTAPAGVRDGWKIVLLLKKAISLLQVYVVTTSPTSGTKFTLKNKDHNKVLAEGSVTLVEFTATKQNEYDDVPCTRAVFMWAKEVPCPTIAPVSGSQSLNATVNVESQWNAGISGKILVLVPAGVDDGWRVRFMVDKPIKLNVYIATATPSSGTTFELTNMDHNEVLVAGTTLEIGFDGTKQEVGSTVLCTSAIFLW